MDLAREAGIDVIERTVMPEEIERADEIFITGTAVEVTAVGQIDQRRYAVGPVTRHLREAYGKLVRSGDGPAAVAAA